MLRVIYVRKNTGWIRRTNKEIEQLYNEPNRTEIR